VTAQGEKQDVEDPLRRRDRGRRRRCRHRHVLAAVPASAATAPCPASYYCFYQDANYRGWHLNYNSTLSGDFNNPPASFSPPPACRPRVASAFGG
jgi:hypothetical protein